MAMDEMEEFMEELSLSIAMDEMVESSPRDRATRMVAEFMDELEH